MQSEIKKEWIYEQLPGEVWEYLTQSELIALWLMPNDFKLIIGHEFKFTTKPIPDLNFDGIIHCRVLEIVPLKKLIYSWKGGSGNGIYTLDTIVEWKLEPHGKGTKLSLKQSGFKESNMSFFIGMSNGWEKIIEKLNAQLNNMTNGHPQS